MSREPQPLVSRIAGDVLTGYYKRKRLTQPEVAERSGIPITTLQKKLQGNAPITATDFVMICRAIGIDPADTMDEVMKELAIAEGHASEGVASLSERRRRKTPAEMTDSEMEGESNAANTDPEIGHDQPEYP